MRKRNIFFKNEISFWAICLIKYNTMETRNNTTALVTIALAGAAVGAILGILFAPEKGSITRGKLVNGAKNLASTLNPTLGNSLEERMDRHEKTSKL
jgi:gas vesicle protein